MNSDWKSIQDDREKYAAYLCSREWSVLKEAVHERAKGLCERCKFLPIDAVHHLTYERKYAEDLGDLEGHCKHCHAFTHGKSDEDPAALPWAIRKYLSICAACKLRPYPPELAVGRQALPYYETLCCAIEQLRSLQSLGNYPVDLSDAADLLNERLPYDYKFWCIWGACKGYDVVSYGAALVLFGRAPLEEKHMLPEDDDEGQDDG